jgi:hypothetical protein
MAATYVTKAELRTNLGIGSLYSDTTVEEVCQTAEDLLNSYLWFDSVPVVAAALASNVATLILSTPGSYAAGQTVTISNCGSTYNGSRVITSTFPWSVGSTTFPYFTFFPWNNFNFPRGYSLIQFSVTAANDPYHLIVPYGKAAGVDTKQTSYATTPAVREAAMMLAVDIWQARQTPATGGSAVDFQPSPYKMGRSLISRVQGLIAPYTGPRSMVG